VVGLRGGARKGEGEPKFPSGAVKARKLLKELAVTLYGDLNPLSMGGNERQISEKKRTLYFQQGCVGIKVSRKKLRREHLSQK